MSADGPSKNLRFKKRLGIPFRLLSDEDHAIADRYEIPISRRHPKAWSYKDGFIQPAVFAYRGDDEVFRFVQSPKLRNLWGASGRPRPDQVVAILRQKLA